MAYTSSMKWTAAIGAALAIATSSIAQADASGTDRPAAIINYPYITVDLGRGIDTLVQLSTISAPGGVFVRCSYVNATPHCSSATSVGCLGDSGCPAGGSCSIAWCSEVDFLLRLTTGQPLAWRASQGITGGLPCTPTLPCGPGGQANEGFVPAIPDPFIGTLQCVAVKDATGAPSDENVLKGEATVEQYPSAVLQLDVAKYNAIGLRAIAGANNQDGSLNLGGSNPEYQACPAVNILNHFTEDAIDPASGSSVLHTTLALMPCTQDWETQTPTHLTMLYSIHNEFEQAFSAAKAFDCAQFGTLSGIDAPAPVSVFSFATLGTLTAQTRISSAGGGGGVLAVAIEQHNNTSPFQPIARAAFNLHMQGESAGDTITYPVEPTTAPTPTRTPTASRTITPSFTPTPLPPQLAIQELAQTVQELGLPDGNTTALASVVGAARRQINAGNTPPACNQLNAFMNQVGAQQRAGRLSAMQANQLMDAAHAIRMQLGC